MEKTELVKPEPTGTVPELGKQSRRFRGGRALGLLIGTDVFLGAIASDCGFIGQSAVLGVSWVFVLVCLILVATGYMFSYTVFGRQMLATGGKEHAARLCGIATDGIVFRAHMISGFLAALAAVLWASMVGSCAPETGDSWLIGSFAVSIIAGTGLTGGGISCTGIFLC